MRESSNHRVDKIIDVDERRGILIKKSRSKDLIDQIDWFINLPSNLKWMIPAIYNYNKEGEEYSISMEYILEGSLDRSFVSGKIEDIERGLEFTEYVLSEFSRYRTESKESDFVNMYYKKTYSRLRDLKDMGDREIVEIIDAPYITINNQRMIGIPKILEDSRSKVERMIDREYHIIHGDLCFNNILIFGKSFRLIDPRGRFGDTKMYGDPKYDIAKLSHSLLGKYDFIMFDKFEVRREGTNQYSLSFPDVKFTPKINRFIKERIDDRIRFIEAHLFLSMTPLHMPYRERVKAMLLNGIFIYNSIQI